MKAKYLILSSLGLVIGAFAINLTYQFNKLKTIGYKVIGGSLKSISKSYIKLNLALEINNPSNIDAYIYNYDIDIFLNGHKVGIARYNKEQYLRANSDTNIIMGLDIYLNKYFNISDVIKYFSWFITDKSKLNIGIKGNMKVKHAFIPANIPFDTVFNLGELQDDVKD